jgi:hypothetical protein
MIFNLTHGLTKRIASWFLPAAVFLLCAVNTHAQITSVKSGDWSDPRIWNTKTVPTANDNVTIDHGDQVVITKPATCKDLHADNGSRLTVMAPLTIEDLVGDNNGARICLQAPLTACSMFLDNGFRLYGGCQDVTITNCNNLSKSVRIENGARWYANQDCDGADCDNGISLNITGNADIFACDITYNNLTVTNGTLNFGSCNVNILGNLKLNSSGDITTSGTLTYGSNSHLIFNRSYTLTGSSKIWGTGTTASNVPPVVQIESGVITLNDSLSIKRRINLLGGSIGTASSTKLRIVAHDTVFKCGGSFGRTPAFGANVTMLYCEPKPGNPPAVLGTEMPASGFTGDVIISTNLILGANIKAPAGKVVVTSTGILNDSNFVVQQANKVEVQPGGVIRTQKPNGLTGDNSLFGNLPLTLGSGTTVEYYASSGTQYISPLTDYGNIVCSSSADKVFPESTVTHISGDFTNTGDGQVTAGKGSIVSFKGGNQQIDGISFYSAAFTGSGTKTFTGSSSLQGALQVENCVVEANDNLTLISNSLGTAQVGQLVNGATITGNVCWQRFIPGGPKNRRWRFLSNPIKNVTFRWWQEDIHITGPGANGVPCDFNTTSQTSMVQNSNGFDQNHTGLSNVADTQAYSTIFTYEETLGKWKTIGSTYDTINPLKAYRTFVRGNRNVEGCLLLTLMPQNVSDVTLKSCGPIVKFTQTAPLSFTQGKGNGWNYVSNPYPSSINWNHPSWVAARGQEISGTIYIWDPVNAQYASWSPVAGSVNGGSNIVATGQSFFVQTNAPKNLVFEETYKVDSGKAGFFGKSSSLVETNRLSITLGTANVIDQAVLFLHKPATSGVDFHYDGAKMGYAANSVAILCGGDQLAFSGIPLTTLADTIQLATWLNPSSTNYTFNFEGISSFESRFTLLLEDQYTGELIKLAVTPSHTFATVTGDAQSSNQSRFRIIILNNSALPVTLTSLQAKAEDERTVKVSWSTAQEENNSHFIVMHGTDGKSFTEIGIVAGHGTTHQAGQYAFTHETPVAGVNYYQLVQVDRNGKQTASGVVTADLTPRTITAAQMRVYPVPAKDFVNVVTGKNAVNSISIFDAAGKQLDARWTATPEGARVSTTGLVPGIYFLSVSAKDAEVTQLRIVIQ